MARRGRLHRKDELAVAADILGIEFFEIAGAVIRRIGVGNILRNDLLALSEPVHLFFEIGEHAEFADIHCLLLVCAFLSIDRAGKAEVNVTPLLDRDRPNG